MKNQIHELNTNYEITLGRVIQYSPEVAIYQRKYASLKFSFMADSTMITGYSIDNVPEYYGPKEGSMYVAVYCKTDPQVCRLLLEYPVVNSGDYEKYLEEFKKNPLKFKDE